MGTLLFEEEIIFRVQVHFVYEILNIPLPVLGNKHVDILYPNFYSGEKQQQLHHRCASHQLNHQCVN